MTRMNSDVLAFKRMVAASVLTRLVLGLVFFTGMTMLTFHLGNRMAAAVMVAASGLTFFGLTWKSMKLARETFSAGEQLAHGDLEGAEQLLVTSIRRFSMFPRQRVVELYHLAMLRQEQGRLVEAAELAQTVLANRRNPSLVDDGALLVRLECLLELSDLHGAYDLLQRIWNRPLELIDQARLLVSRTRYEVMTGAYEQMLWGLSDKLKLTELMPPSSYGTLHAYWALAARKTGREPLGRWLLCRAVAVAGSLSTETKDLASRIPDLADWIQEETAVVSGDTSPYQDGTPE